MNRSSSNNCPICNAPTQPGAEYCPNCGYQLGKIEPTIKTPAPPEPPSDPRKTDPLKPPDKTQISGTVPAGEGREQPPIHGTVPAGDQGRDTQRIEGEQFLCPLCGQLHPIGAKFCPIKGVPLDQTIPAPQPTLPTENYCPKCGSGNPEGAKFCGNCRYNFESVEEEKSRPPYLWIAIIVVLLLLGCAGISFLGYADFKNLIAFPDLLNRTPEATELAESDDGTEPPSPEETPVITPPTITLTPTATETPTDIPKASPSPTYTLTNTPTETPSNGKIPPDYNFAFTSDRYGSFQVYITDLAFNLDPVVFPVPVGYAGAWEPTFCDGDLLAEITKFGNDENNQPIYKLPFGGDPESVLDLPQPSDASALGVPKCSPDGEYLAYGVRVAGDNWKIYITNWDEKLEEYGPLFQSYITSHASFSADNSNIVYGHKSRSEGDYTIWYSPFPSIDEQKLTYTVSSGLITEYRYPSISPDGRRVAFMCRIGSGNFYLCVADLFSMNATVLIEAYPKNYKNDKPGSPAWSADGYWIYFAKHDGSDWDIHRIPANGGVNQNLTSTWNSNEKMPAVRMEP